MEVWEKVMRGTRRLGRIIFNNTLSDLQTSPTSQYENPPCLPGPPCLYGAIRGLCVKLLSAGSICVVYCLTSGTGLIRAVSAKRPVRINVLVFSGR